MYERENGQDSDKEFIGGAREEVDITDRIYIYGRTEVEYDEFEDIDLRLQFTGGLGWVAIRQTDEELKLFGGLGYQYEVYTDDTHDDWPVGELGLYYTRKCNDWVQVTHNTTYYPSLETMQNYRIVSESALEVPLTKKEDWKFRIGMRNQYDSQPGGGDTDRLETTYFMNLVLDIY